MPTPKNLIGQLFRHHRQEALLNQAHLAELMHCHHSLISKIETGARFPKVEHVAKLIEVLKLSSDKAKELHQTHLQAQQQKLAPRPVPVTDKTALTWPNFVAACTTINQANLPAGTAKYNPHLYLPRPRFHQTLANFVTASAGALALVGHSGVGKTTLVEAAIAHFAPPQAKNQAVAVLRYQGANLFQPLSQHLAHDLHALLPDIPTSNEAFWPCVQTLCQQNKTHLLLCLDAINESDDPFILLKEVNDYLHQAWPWFKILLTSRPETWRQIQRQLHLRPQDFYHSPTSDNSLAFTVTAFSNEEVALAYHKYQQAYQLKTSFQELGIALQTLLTDPLSLLLVANIFQKRAIDQLHPQNLIAQYLAALVRTARLWQADVKWLHEIFMPLMLNSEHISNALAQSYLFPAGQNDQHANTLQRLIDAGVLVRQETALPDEAVSFAFRYERFYDYFVAQHLRKLSHTASAPLNTYLKFAEKLPQHLYLWGGLRTALLAELEEGQESLFIALGEHRLPFLQAFLTDTLIHFAQTQTTLATQTIQTMLTHSQASVRQIAIRVAGELGHLPVLYQALSDKDEQVQETAIQAACQVWAQNEGQGWQILSHWLNTVSFKRNSLRTLKAGLTLSGFALTDASRPIDDTLLTLYQLRVHWRATLLKYPKWFLQKIFLPYTSKMVVQSTLGQLLEAFFTLTPGQQEKFHTLTQAYDWSFAEIQAQEELFLDIFGWNEEVFNYVICQLLIVKLPFTRDLGLPWLWQLMKRTIQIDPMLHANGKLIMTAAVIIQRSDVKQARLEVLEPYRGMMQTYLEETRGLYATRAKGSHRHFGLDFYTQLAWQWGQSQPTTMFHTAFQVVKAADITSAQQKQALAGILQDISHLTTMHRLPALGLQALTPWFQHQELWLNEPALTAQVVDCLAQIRWYAPNLLDDYMQRYQLLAEVRQQVYNQALTEPYTTSGYYSSLFLFFVRVLIHRPATLRWTLDLVRSTRCFQMPQAWLADVFNQVLDLIVSPSANDPPLSAQLVA